MDSNFHSDIESVLYSSLISCILLASIFLFFDNSNLFGLILFAIGISVLLGRRSLEYSLPEINFDKRYLDISIYLGIVCMVLSSYTNPIGVPTLFYLLMCVVACLLLTRVYWYPEMQVVFPILLYAGTIRLSYWYAAPAFGRDTIKHLRFSQYMIQYGEPIPPSVNYYHYYPTAHSLVTSVSHILDVPVRVAYFLGIGIPIIFGILGIAIILPRLLTDSTGEIQTINFACLYLALAPFHIRYSTHILAQSLTLAYLPFVIFAFISDDKRFLSIGILSGIIMIFTHNTPGIIISIFGIILIVTRYLSNHISLPVSHDRTSPFIVFVIGILLLEYWIRIEYISLQISRIFRLFDAGGSLFSTTSGSSSVAAAPNFIQSPILHRGLGLLFGAAVILAILIHLLNKIRSNNIGIAIDYYITVSIIFAGLSSVVFIGLDTEIRRLFPFAPILISPIVGYLFYRVAGDQNVDIAVTYLTILIIPCLILTSAAGAGFSPAVAMTEDRPEHYRNYVTSSQISGAITIGETAPKLTVDWYMVHGISHLFVERNHPKRDSVDNSPISQANQIRIIDKQGEIKCNNTFYYLDYYSRKFGTQPPKGHRILDVGDAFAIDCKETTSLQK
ncbi:hypothetical protein JZX76_05415 [Haloarcula hispanica]|uniref:Uncharacterized protein n=1 Tax=Haloarcula hispanica TaxID=51589 RepID=A0A482SZY3_HALHI|nr:hypothetical protein [Haloarcula hispanica]MCJ0618975.1 hypothetical protein [Haloarcula hispanica]RYJ09508.1 hypothetical protein ELS20_05390 [Haloarcula hispanica]